MLCNSILDLIGNTPIVRLKNMESKFALNSNIELYGKLERNNPAGSIKDRAVKQIILDLFKDGKLKDPQKILQALSTMKLTWFLTELLKKSLPVTELLRQIKT